MAKSIPDSSKNRWSELVEIIEEARRQYYVLDSPTISDDEYDKAFKEINEPKAFSKLQVSCFVLSFKHNNNPGKWNGKQNKHKRIYY